MDPLRTLAVRFHFNLEFVNRGRKKQYYDGREAMPRKQIEANPNKCKEGSASWENGQHALHIKYLDIRWINISFFLEFVLNICTVFALTCKEVERMTL